MVPKKTSFAIFAMLLIAIAPPATRSQTDFWQPTTAPKGDYILSIAFDSSGNAFIGTLYGGIFRSSDNGDHWTQVSAGIPGVTASSIVVLPDGTILAGVSASVYRSTDHGAGWEESVAGGNFTSVNTLAADDSSHVLAGDTRDGVYRSTNGGRNWESVRIGLLDSMINVIRITHHGVCFAGTWNRGLFRSTDYGSSWTSTTITNVPVLSLAEDSAGHLFAGTDGKGLLESTNDGTEWVSVGFPNDAVNSVACGSNGHIIVGTYMGMYLSTDHGLSWSEVGFGGDRFSCLEVSPSGDIFAGTWGYGVFRSTDNGDTWSQPFAGLTSISVNSLFCSKAGTVFAATNRTVFRLSDSSAAWVQCSRGFTTGSVQTLTEGDSGRLFAGTWEKGLFRSTDNGNSWKQIGPQNIYVKSIVLNHMGELVTASGCAYLVSQDGSTWSQSLLPFPMQLAASLAVDSTGLIFMGLDSGGVFMSTDNGTSWHPRGPGIPFPVPAMTVTHKQYVLAGEYHGQIIRSKDKGLTWGDASTGFTTWNMNFLTTFPNGYVFTGITGPNGSTICFSKDDGDHWTQFGTSLINVHVQSAAVDRAGYVFLGTADAGIYRSTQPLTSIGPVPGAEPMAFLLEQNYPNPFNPSTTILFSLRHHAQTNLTLFNALGQVITVLINGEVSAGSHAVRLDGSNLASGVYFYRLKAGEYVATKRLILVR